MSEALKQAAQKLLAHVEDKGEGRRSTCLPFDVEALRAALSQPAPSPQPAVPVVSDEQIRKIVESIQDPDTVPAFHNGYYTLTPDELRRAILALRPTVEPMTPEQREVLAALVVGACEHKTRTLLALRAIEATEAQYGIGITAKAEGVRDGRST